MSWLAAKSDERRIDDEPRLTPLAAEEEEPQVVKLHAALDARIGIAETWGRADLASSDMMSLETRQRVWQARIDPRRQTPSVGIHSHVRDRWGIFHAPLAARMKGPQRAALSTEPNYPQVPNPQLQTLDNKKALSI